MKCNVYKLGQACINFDTEKCETCVYKIGNALKKATYKHDNFETPDGKTSCYFSNPNKEN